MDVGTRTSPHLNAPTKRERPSPSRTTWISQSLPAVGAVGAAAPPRERFKVIVSDLHIGTGSRRGQLNPWESFSDDDRFCEFLEHHSTGEFADADVELIINGDFFDFLQVRVRGRFPVRVHETLGVAKIKRCMDGHRGVIDGLRAFVQRPRKRITILPGNHDFEWVFPGVQEAFTRRLLGTRKDPRVRVICDRPFYEFDGIRVEHGQQYEIWNYHNYLELFVRDARGVPILNLPWGSEFLLQVIFPLKQERPYIDRVRPFKAYMIRALVFDPLFFLKAAISSLLHFIRTRVLSLRHFGARMRQNWQILTQAEVYPDLAGKVRHVLEERPELHTMVLGHTHVPLVRRLRGGRQYINSGCWTETVSFDLGSFGQRSRPTYVLVEYPEQTPDRPILRLREWNGTRAKFRELSH